MIKDTDSPSTNPKSTCLPEKTRKLIASQVLDEYQKRKEASLNLPQLNEELIEEIIKIIDQHGKLFHLIKIIFNASEISDPSETDQKPNKFSLSYLLDNSPKLLKSIISIILV